MYSKKLDRSQLDVVLDESNYLLVVAGAGSGKTFTITEKIKYLIEEKNIDPSLILCISFTNESVDSLKKKLSGYNIDVLTFHKLGLKILSFFPQRYEICPIDYLEYIVHEFFYGIVFESNYIMKKILNYFGYICFFNIERKYYKFINYNMELIYFLEKMICTFIKLFKSNNYTINAFIRFKKRCVSKKESLFLLIALNIYLIYENELSSNFFIDFDDMIIKSKELVCLKECKLKYKYVIVDEYQDTSYSRYLLLKEIIEKNDSKFIAVGDDFQSIYGFSGCNIEMFINFIEYFPSGKIKKLENTYRNSQELINIAGNFIMRNNKHISKNMNSFKNIKNPIKICYGYNVYEIVNMINTDVMILGRNNKDIDYIDCSKFNNNVYCLTVHKSKGLEEENVVIVNVIDSYLGFPNKIENDKVLRFVSINKDLYDEERRLFYVALTRTKNNVYIMTEKGKESIFVKELVKDYNYGIEIIKK